MSVPGLGDTSGRELPTHGGQRHTRRRAATRSGQAIEVRTYGPDGEYQLMMPVEFDDRGAPPRTVELLGSNTAGRAVLRHYTRDHDNVGWVYTHTTRSIGNFR